MNSAYQISLEEAQQELAVCEEKITTLERQRANLRQIIAILQAKLGMDDAERPKTLTDAILLVVKGTRERESIMASDIVGRLEQMGVDAEPRSVATILSRLHKEGRINSWKMHNSVGYEWKGVRTKSDSLNALKALAEMGQRERTKSKRKTT